MKIILLSGGSGKRLWPLSNDARSKQFLKVLETPDGSRESMIQRVVRMIKENNLTEDITVSTGASQKDIIERQLGDDISVITEPCRRDTFPAIALACAYLYAQGTSLSEPIIVMPCDSFTQPGYFKAIGQMADAVEIGVSDMVLMGIRPTYPSAKYGYIVPVSNEAASDVKMVSYFKEKPDSTTAEKLISEGALWNGGVFAFRLGYLIDIAQSLVPTKLRASGLYDSLLQDFGNFPKISFDYAVVEKAKSVTVVEYSGEWKDLGTWNVLTEELKDKANGNVIADSCDTSYIINELDIPMVCMGAENMVIAATPDGILVTDRNMSEKLKDIVNPVKRPMYERRRWGTYKVIDSVEFPDGYCALTKRITLEPGKCISYQRHNYRSEIWTIIDGEGEVVLNETRKPIRRGDVINIEVGQMHALKATTPLTFIEVQSGTNLIEEDIERFPYIWESPI
ncbi:MAG: cupin domain-containing protein [Muribaculaceae bacterium]|nr:cupin domain-containing protein [Muribaculaceae bacterium]